MTRHASVHAAGVVIAPKAITEYAPLYKGARDEIVTQWSMKEIERVGLLKMDFLGLQHADAASTTRSRRSSGRRARRSTSTTSRSTTRRPTRSSRTARPTASSSSRSSGMRDILRKAKPQRLDDLIALNALYRPGPLRSGMVDDFIARKQGKTEIKYELPRARAGARRHLRRHRLPGTGDAHLERRSPASRSARRTCCARRWARRRRTSWPPCAPSSSTARRRTGISEKKAAHLFDLMEHFAGYGFNKSHSTAYAFLAYQTAYLKANYPWHFAAALLTIEAQNTDKLALYLGECRERGIPVLPPDINESQLRFTVEPGKGVRFGLTAIKNVGEGAIESLLEVRAEAGAHRVARRAVRGARHAPGQQARVREPRQGGRVRLARAGHPAYEGAAVRGAARAAAGRRRRGVRARRAVPARPRRGAGAALRRVRRRRPRGRERRTGARLALPDAPPWSEAEQLAFEKETLGLYWSGHPVDRYAARAEGVRRALDGASSADAPVSAAPADAWGPGGRKPIEPDAAHRRHRRRLPPAEDAQGRPHGGVHARGRAGRRRGDRRFPETVPAERQPDRDRARWCSSAASWSATTSRCGFWRPRSRRSTACASASRARWRSACRCRPTAHVFEALGEVFSRHRGDRRVSFEMELPAEPRRLRVRADVQLADPRPAVADAGRRAGADRRRRARLVMTLPSGWTPADAMPLKRWNSKSRSPSS